MNQGQMAGEKPCNACGKTIDSRAEICPKCGVRQFYPSASMHSESMHPPAGSDGRRSNSFPERSSFQEAKEKKLTAGICGILLGSFGVHKFILGYRNAGIIMLSVTVGLVVLTTVFMALDDYISIFKVLRRSVLSLAASAVGIIGIVEGVLYLSKTDREFHQTYILNDREWF